MADQPGIEAVIFDLDGVLIDSEPLWLVAVRQGLLGVGIDPTPDEYRLTQGMRVDRLVAFWHERHPWAEPPVEAVTARMLDTVLELIQREGKPLPGALRAVETFGGLGLPLALASSSPMTVIDAALEALGLADRFSVVYSAEAERYGKPHPGVYLSTAARLGVAPQKCLAIEDTIIGLLAAKAAQMPCLCVPEADLLGDPRLGIADRVLPTLEALDAAAAARLAAGDFSAGMNSEIDERLSDLRGMLLRVDPDEQAGLEQAIAEAPRVFVAGMGRTGLVMRTFAMRLMHLGGSVHLLGDATTPGIAAGDLLLVGSGSGRTPTLVSQAERARERGAQVAVLTADRQSPLAGMAHHAVIVPPVDNPGGGHPLGSAFEAALYLLLDGLVLRLMDRLGVDEAAMQARHANLE